MKAHGNAMENDGSAPKAHVSQRDLGMYAITRLRQSVEDHEGS